ncbi:MAG: DUF4926 domain-containing protein [Acidobacteria bacterium]|nr:DUF4926 domain-containing protein [Acidobacteriota bacterium]
MKLPNADQAVVDRRKIVDYLLSRRHPDGRNKAAFFFAFGFRTARWERFAEALRTHGRNGTVTGRAESAYGVRYSVDGVVEIVLKEHDRVVLTADISDSHLKAGDVGTIVHVYRRGAAFEVEFHALDGNTAAVATVPSSRVRPATGADITHAREIETADASAEVHQT